MYRPVSPQPSGLLQQQPQRYSDRHLQQPSSSGKYPTTPTTPTRRPRAAPVSGGFENSFQPDDTTPSTQITQITKSNQTSKMDDDQGIKSYLKKTHGASPSRASKADANNQTKTFKSTEKY